VAGGHGWSQAVPRPAVLLPFVLVSFAANSLATRHAVATHLIDPGLLGAMRFIAGAIALVAIAVVRREKIVVGRSNLRPALCLGAYAVYLLRVPLHRCGDGNVRLLRDGAVDPGRTRSRDGIDRACAARLATAVSLGGIAILTFGSVGGVTPIGVVLLAVTGAAWGLYTAAGHVVIADARTATTGHFVVAAAVGAPAAVAGAAAGLCITAQGVAWAAVMGAGTTALAYVAWYACQRSMSGTSAGSAQLIVPLLTSAGAVVFLGEQPSMTLAIAAAFVGAGTWLALPRSGRRPRSGRPPHLLARTSVGTVRGHHGPRD
jgi:drug/metabolite transporter (DMT)-like permease